jgi:4-oxalmesaconate hydratase
MGEENVGDGWHTLDEMMANVWFDTCVYHQPGIDLLFEVVPIENVLFASEMVGAVKGLNPDTGEYYDDTRKYVDRAELTDEQRRQVFELNVQRVYPRLKIGA